MDEEQMKQVYTDFKQNVNMSPSELELWLDTKESKSVGWDSGDGESIGHKSGKKIIEIKHKKKEQLSPGDYKHMQKVVGYIKRHLAQRPDGNLNETDWNYSLKNWGHDFKKEK
ncbi:DUF3140 domain-containing protein [Pedobacter sp. Leaf194]|uniref:DUF3140 domain-containing protein n=1 Tax=Pedobacter sp. Leaf194 TaxID=1736297 RepID=UPI000702FBC5|nr:DUF3140 domain-containing protein [Pedobacter sp. Leaf194]KQS36163.1 DNA-binding protein [Pedobacter sp. Leaf194]